LLYGLDAYGAGLPPVVLFEDLPRARGGAGAQLQTADIGIHLSKLAAQLRRKIVSHPADDAMHAAPHAHAGQRVRA